MAGVVKWVTIFGDDPGSISAPWCHWSRLPKGVCICVCSYMHYVLVHTTSPCGCIFRCSKHQSLERGGMRVWNGNWPKRPKEAHAQLLLAQRHSDQHTNKVEKVSWFLSILHISSSWFRLTRRTSCEGSKSSRASAHTVLNVRERHGGARRPG